MGRGNQEEEQNERRFTHSYTDADEHKVGEEVPRLGETWRIQLKTRPIRPYCVKMSALVALSSGRSHHEETHRSTSRR